MAIYFFVNYIIHNQQLGLGESINFNRGWYSFCLKHLCNLLTNWSPVCWTSVDSVLCLECYAMYNVSNVVQCLSNIPRMLPLCYVIALLLCSARNGPVRHLKLNWIPSKTCGEFFLPVSTVMCLSWAACGRWSHSAGCDVIAPRLDRATNSRCAPAEWLTTSRATWLGYSLFHSLKSAGFSGKKHLSRFGCKVRCALQFSDKIASFGWPDRKPTFRHLSSVSAFHNWLVQLTSLLQLVAPSIFALLW